MRLIITVFFAFFSFVPLMQSRFAIAAPPQTYAQKLMTDALARHPNLLFLIVRANAPTMAGTTYAAGKVDKTEIAYFESSGLSSQVDQSGTRYLVQLPLQDVAGATIGSVTEGFAYKAGDDTSKLRNLAEDIRHELRRRVTNAGNLLEPFPYDSTIFAQRLVDQTMDAHPEILILAIHVARPHETTSIILGSNIGRIGKKDTEDDMQVLRTGKPYLEIKAPGDRYEDILLLRNKSGETVGTVAVLLPLNIGADPARAQRQAESIRDEMSKEIPSLSRLFEPR
jgi:hypothetical protein